MRVRTSVRDAIVSYVPEVKHPIRIRGVKMFQDDGIAYIGRVVIAISELAEIAEEWLAGKRPAASNMRSVHDRDSYDLYAIWKLLSAIDEEGGFPTPPPAKTPRPLADATKTSPDSSPGAAEEGSRIQVSNPTFQDTLSAQADRAQSDSNGAPQPLEATIPPEWRRHHAFGYIVHVDNIASILEHGILSYRRAIQHPHTSLADPQVQARRDSQIHGRTLTIHDHANVYLNPRNAMLYRLVRNKPLISLVVIRVDARRVLNMPDAVVSDRNAAVHDVLYYPASNALTQIDHDVVFSERWAYNGVRDEELKQKMMAEVLVPDVIPASLITGITVATAAGRSRLEYRYPGVEVSTDARMFFQ